MGRGGKGGGCPVLECVGKGISYIINTQMSSAGCARKRGRRGCPILGVQGSLVSLYGLWTILTS